ncbi:MAG: hypothetical protein WD963_02330 [Candidatus Paceibacterota bacterium]
MKIYRFTIEIVADSEADAKKEFSEHFCYDLDNKDGWYEVSVKEIKY